MNGTSGAFCHHSNNMGSYTIASEHFPKGSFTWCVPKFFEKLTFLISPLTHTHTHTSSLQEKNIPNNMHLHDLLRNFSDIKVSLQDAK